MARADVTGPAAEAKPSVPPAAMETIGVDLGGTKMAVGVLDRERRVLYRSTAPSVGLHQDEVLATLERQLRAAIAARPLAAPGGPGGPGAIDRARGAARNAGHPRPPHRARPAVARHRTRAPEGALAAERHPDSALGRLRAAGLPIEGKAVTDAALAGDPIARAAVADIGRNLGVALASLTNIFDPDVIVIGGGVSVAGDLL